MSAKQRWFAKLSLMLMVIVIGGWLLAGCGSTPTSPAIPNRTTENAPTAVPTTVAPIRTTEGALTTATTLTTVTPAATPTSAATRPASTVTNTPQPGVTSAINAVTATPGASGVTATTVPSPRPAFSRLAYIDNNSLFVIDTANNQKNELFKGGQSTIVGDPDWSQEANLIVIALQIKGKGAILQTLTPSGTNPKTLVSDQPEGSSDQFPVFSPNGRTIAFTRIYDTNKDGRFDRLDSRQEIWLVDSTGQNPRKLVDGRHPAWAPDSQRIAFVTNGESKPDYNFLVNNALKLINAQGQNEWEPFNTKKVPEDLSGVEYPFAPGTVYLQYPSFLDGGRKIAFSAVGSSGLVITINSSTGGDVRVWNGNPEGAFGRTFNNPAGSTKLLYENLPPSGTHLLTLVDTAQTATALSKIQNKNFGDSKTQVSAVYPAWSNDGNRLAYVETTSTKFDGAVTGSLLLATLKADGTWESKELTKGTFSGANWEK